MPSRSRCDSRGPHRPTVGREEPRQDPSFILIAVVIAEVEKGVAIIGVRAGVRAQLELAAEAGVPAELARGLGRSRLAAGAQLDAGRVPSAAAKQITAAGTQPADADVDDSNQLFRYRHPRVIPRRP